MIYFKRLLARYYLSVRPQTNDFHAVHREECPFIPEADNRIFLGGYSSEDDALSEAQNVFQMSNKCRFCCCEHSVGSIEKVLSEINEAVYTKAEMMESLLFS